MSYWHMYYLCPYFRWDGKTEIGCEGKTILRFPAKSVCRNHLKTYCAGDWEQCSYAKSMTDYYEGDENGRDNKRSKEKNK